MIAHGLLLPQQQAFNPLRTTIPCAIKASKSISFSSVPSLRSVSSSSSLSSSMSSNQDTVQPASLSSSSSLLPRTSRQPPPPPPPWTFDVKRIYYEFRAIPIDQARKYCPPILQQQQQQQRPPRATQKVNNIDDLSRPLQILSFGGYTLGGIFCVEYQSSPVGPYKEVAILSSLLMDDILQFLQNLIQQQQQQRTTPILPQIGAWASHIYVDSKDAAYWGQQYWGLPATTLSSIQFMDSNIGDKNNRREDPNIVFDFVKNSITVSDWDSTIKTLDKNTPPSQSPLPSEEKSQSQQASSLAGGSATSTKPKWRISLPSFSGLLPLTNTTTSSSSSSSSRTPLLQYPLSIMFGPSSDPNSDSNSSRIAWVPGKKLNFVAVNATTATTTTTQRRIMPGDENEETSLSITQEELLELFHNSFTLGSIQVDNIQLEAGIATNIPETT